MLASYSRTLKTLLLAAAILAPATTLAIFGLRAYRAETLLLRDRLRQDQAAIVRLVADRISDLARKALEDLEERCRSHDPDAAMDSRFTASHPLARHVFLVRWGQLIYPSPPSPSPTETGRSRELRLPGGYLTSELDVQNYVGRLRESRRLANVVASALRAEEGGKIAAAQSLYQRAGRGRGDHSAQALLGLARIQRRLGLVSEAADTYGALRGRFEAQQDSEGVSYALLADAGRAEIGSPSRLRRLHQRLLEGSYPTTAASRRFYLRWAMERLARLRGADESTLTRLRAETGRLFASEEFGGLLVRHGIAELQGVATTAISSVVLDRRTSLVLRQRAETVIGYSLDETFLHQTVAAQQREVVAPVRGIQLRLQRLGEGHAVPQERVLHASVLPQPLGDWTLAALLTDADPAEMIERRAGLRRQGLAMGLVLVLLVGLILTYRGVRRESELAQLKSDFASNVSHELKTPLTSIRMYAEMLDQGIAATPEDRDRYHQVIIRESERLGRLIANVLDFSRVERGTRHYDLHPEDLESLTREAVETFSRLSAESDPLIVKLQPSDGALPRVTADREAAIQCVLNLLDNAAKYSPGGPRIEVTLRSDKGGAAVVVRDEGIGIPAVEHKHIFDDFYRAPGARQVGVEGTGLGLALVRRHMIACGGRVEVHSTVGKGSTFTLWFAAAPRPQEEDHGVDPGD
jgi:signal transduction histidine kinase